MSEFLCTVDETTNKKMIDSIFNQTDLLLLDGKIYGTKENFNSFLALVTEGGHDGQGKIFLWLV